MQYSELQKKKLPDTPGVYFFHDRRGKVLYIGKATSLRNRTRSYFTADVSATRGERIIQMREAAEDVTFEKTDSVLEALMLEAHLIRQHQPPYNAQGKDDKSYNTVVITKENFPRILLVRGKDLARIKEGVLVSKLTQRDIKYTFGPFPHGGQLKEAMRIIRRIFPFRDKCVIGQGKPCFNAQIGLCPGVCSGIISQKEYSKTIRHLKLFFEGKKMQLMKRLEKDMKGFAKREEFEEAARIKKTIFALNHIQDVALITSSQATGILDTSPLRIEAYDIAHMSGKNSVGVMTVVEDGEAQKDEYRKFRIRGAYGNNDTASLKEVLERRLGHDEWPLPQLMVVDGSTAQVNTAKRVVKEHFEDLADAVSVVGVVKDERHRPKQIVGDKAFARRYERPIILANNEAHRFAIGYHRKMRRKMK